MAGNLLLKGNITKSSYASEQATKDKTFGHGVKITARTGRNNVEAVFGLGARNAQSLPVKQFEGALSVEFILATPWFFRAVLGAAPNDSGTDPTTHTFSESNTVDSMSIENEISSDTVSTTAFLGCKVVTCVITAAINELAKVRLDMIYADEDEDTSASADVPETFEPYTFAQASLEFPNGSTINDIQNVEITISNNPEMIFGLGSRVGAQLPVKNRSYTARITRPFEDAATFLEAFYGSGTGPNVTVAETATMELLFDNGLAGASTREIFLLFTGVKIDEHNLPQDPTALIIEDLALVMRSLTVTAKDNVSSAP